MANFNIDYLVVAGGGGGGAAAYSSHATAGGGGAGGYRNSYDNETSGGGGSSETALTLASNTPYDVTVGQGGNGAAYQSSASQPGEDSVFDTITSIGGGGGASRNINSAEKNGGSGGGGCYGRSNGSGTANQGYDGGWSGGNTLFVTGGGGGAGSLGTQGDSQNSSSLTCGGNGLTSSITGSPITRAEGGGASTTSSPTSFPALKTGSGGYGGNEIASGATLRKGSNGEVIIRFPTADVASYTATGLTPTETTDGTDTILSFTTVGTGTITFTAPPPPTPFDGTRATTPVTGFNKTGTSEGLKLPSGDNSNQPTGAAAEQGMIRNDTQETVDSSASAIVHYNGTNWQYFAATESPDPVPTNPLILSSVMYYSASDTTSYPGSGTDWFDLSGNSNTATITSSNYSNGYFDLTPTASIITTPVNTLYQTFSYSIWVKFDSVTVASGYALNVLSKSQFYASNVQAFPLYAAVTTTGTFTNNLSYGNDYSPDVTNSTSVSVNTWYNIACVIDTTTNTSKLYIGTESTQLALVNSVNYTGTLVNSPNQFYSLGKAPAEYGGGVGKSSMNGKIAKFGFWDTALTEAELITIWGLGSGVT